MTSVALFLAWALGVVTGAGAVWWYFTWNNLIRSREEWEKASKPWANKGEPEELS